MKRACLLLPVVVMALQAGCRLFAANVPCTVDDNCPRDQLCRAEICVPAAGDIEDAGPDDDVDAGPNEQDAGPNEQDAGPGSDFTHEHVITVDGSSFTEDLVGFPVLVRPGGDVPTAVDLGFFDDSGAAALPFEVAHWGDVDEREIWVRAPLIPAGESAQIVMRRRNDAASSPISFAAEDVWDDAFFGVWHLGDEISGGVALDSTANGLHGDFSSFGGGVDSVPGMAGHAVPLDGVDDHVRVAGPAAVDLPGSFTVEAWVKTDRVQEQRIVSRMGFDNQRGWQLSTEESQPGLNGVYMDTSFDGVTVQRTGYFELAPALWLYVVGTFVPSTRRALFANGVQNDLAVTGVAASQFQPDTDLTFGITPGGTNALQGVIDEVRISTIERPATWIEATHAVVTGDIVELGPAQPL